MICNDCGSKLHTFEGEIYCPDCTRFGLANGTDASEPGLAVKDLADDHTRAVRDTGLGTEDHGTCAKRRW